MAPAQAGPIKEANICARGVLTQPAPTAVASKPTHGTVKPTCTR
jgi:hypothetical protein